MDRYHDTVRRRRHHFFENHPKNRVGHTNIGVQRVESIRDRKG